MPRGATLNQWAAFNRAYSHELCDCDPHDVNAPRCRSTLPIGNPAIPGRVCYRSKYRSRRSRSSAALNDHTAWTQSPGYGRGRSSRMRFCAGPAERIPGALRRARPPTGVPSTAFRLVVRCHLRKINDLIRGGRRGAQLIGGAICLTSARLMSEWAHYCTAKPVDTQATSRRSVRGGYDGQASQQTRPDDDALRQEIS
jgi:hypothetical protein